MSGAVDFSAVKDDSGNSIAVVAGTSDWDVEEVDFANPSDNNTIAITYGTGASGEVSKITGDIVSGFGGDISITQNASMSRSTSNSSLRIVGNALAGNGGKLNLSLGDGGYFEYTLNTDGLKELTLLVRSWGNETTDPARAFDILVDGDVLVEENISGRWNRQEHVDVEYPLPATMTDGKETITVTFRSRTGTVAGGIFNVRILKK